MKTIAFFIGLSLFFFSIIPTHSKAQSIEGCITNGITGDPFENATIDCGPYTSITGPDGCYVFFLDPGTYNLTCVYGDLCPFDTTITLVNNQAIQLDIQLYPCLDLIVEPLNIEVVLEPNAQTTEIITISNPNEISVEWSAELEIFPPGNTDNFLDVQFQYPLTGTDSHVGIECDGTYFYTTDPYSGIISKYALDGTFIETFTMITGLYDLAFDGVYFYGGNSSTTIFQMDFNTPAFVSTITAPGNVRAIAYNHDEDIFYGYSWGGDIMVFDQSGANLGGSPVGPSGANYSGFAYDNVTDGSPYLWGYGSVGTDLNSLVQMQLPTLQETGLIISLSELLPEPLNNGAGGLFSHPDIFPGTSTLGGIVVNEWIWGLELAGEQQTWVSIEPISGVLAPGESEEISVYFDATDLFPWDYHAEIQFSTIPDMGSPVVDITLWIEGQPGLMDMQYDYSCTDVFLQWETLPPGCMYVDSMHVYKDSLYYATTYECQFVDSMVFPEIEHTYFATGYFFQGLESNPTNIIDVIIPLPSGLEPANIDANIINNNILCLSWSTNGCLPAEYYSLYKNSELLAQLNEPVYCDTLSTSGYYEYYVTATYYFGEFGPSNSFYFLYTETDKTIKNNRIKLFPNPAEDKLHVGSSFVIDHVDLFDLQGSVIISDKFNNKEIQLDISDLNPGVYFLKFKLENKVILKKVIVK